MRNAYVVNETAIVEENRQIQEIVKDALQKLMTKDFRLLVIPIIEQIPQRINNKNRQLDMRFQKTLDEYL